MDGGTRIRNIVFDVGGVLLRFDGRLFARPYVKDDTDAELLDAALFSSPFWLLLDAGAISEETMERIAADTLPERLRSALHECFAGWHNRQPVIAETNELAIRLHEKGYGCYILSNAGTRFSRLKDRIPSLPCMDGWVASAFERIMKPDPAIYLTLCERYGLRPEECLFVDDNIANVRGAEVAGMMGHLFVGADELECHLRELGVEA